MTTTRIYAWYDSGIYGDYAEARTDALTQEGGGFGDNNLVFEVPTELWDQYCAAREAKDTAEDKIQDYKIAARRANT